MTRCVFDDMIGQARAASFLRTSVESGRVSHAYLFVGPPGAGKKTAAKSFACALLCDDHGCGACPACARVRRGAHPDVHLISPEGASGYLAEQVRDIIHDVNLSPMEGSRKIYLIESADLFNDASANALLKTLEEPPDDVVLVLMAHARDSVLPTIASRCQVVRFVRVPPSEAVALLVSQSGAEPAEAAAALAASGGVIPRARDFLASPSRREARTRILGILSELDRMDEHDVLVAAKELFVAVKAPLAEVKVTQAAEAAERAEILGNAGAKQMEERHKRELTAREREGIGEVLNVAESWLRDCLAMAQGVGDLVINEDVRDAMAPLGAVLSPSAAQAAFSAVGEARRRISYNVSPQLAIEVMLFDIRKVLRCPR